MDPYHLLQLGFKAVFKVLTKIEVEGVENVPKQGPYILAVNHLTLLEPPVIFVGLPIERITVLAARKWENSPFVGWVLRTVDGVFIHRDQIDRQALKESLAVLKQGGVLGLAPEGTRSKIGGLMEGKTGIAYLAMKAQVPVLPIGVSGQINYLEHLKRFRRIPLRMKVGPVIHLPPLTKGDKNAQMREATDQIMVAIARLIDPEIRGVYAEQAAQAEAKNS